MMFSVQQRLFTYSDCRGREEIAKLEFWGGFKGLFLETREERVMKKHEKLGDFFYGWFQCKFNLVDHLRLQKTSMGHINSLSNF